MYKLQLLLPILLLGFTTCNTGPQPEAYDPPGSTNTETKPINYQVKKTWRFNGGEVNLSNEFTGARMNEITQVNDTLYIGSLESENYPVNKSPWYAFSVWSRDSFDITLELTYPAEYSHRYFPKISMDLEHWVPLDSFRFALDTVSGKARINLPVSPDTLYVAAQPLWTSEKTYRYTTLLDTLSGVQKSIAGFSKLGKPIELLRFGNPHSGKTIVILGRQHPPEVTGFLALQAFVERILEPDSLARNFRNAYTTLLFPLLNPDGVDNGHWRHSAAGIDLNRDWHSFNQPETQSVRDYLTHYLQASDTEIIFEIDFHSTQEDLFYVFDRNKPSNFTGFTHRWLDSLDSRLDYYTADRVPTSGDSPVSTQYFHQTFNAEAVTYEVGDHSSPELINEISRTAAEEMMEILLSD